MKIKISNLIKSYNDNRIFDNFNLEFSDENINCIVGQSGCGKSTLLNILANLAPIEGGKIEGISKGDISYIFQEDRLIEWLTVRENLEFALKKYFNNDDLAKEINYVLKLVGIEDVKDKYPNVLSGGMRQRVNIARAFGKPAKVILMDEPFKSLDYKLKYTIIDEFKRILAKEKRMVVLVTHDVDEAIYFKGNVIVFGDKPVKVRGIFTNNLKENKDKILSLI